MVSRVQASPRSKSIQSPVPVKPVWPIVSAEQAWPPDQPGKRRSQPQVRCSCWGVRIASIIAGEAPLPSSRPTAKSSTPATVPNSPEGFVLPGATRWIVGGAVTASVDGREFLLVSNQTPWLSVMGTGSVLLLLFTLAYLESNLRALRRRQTGVAAVIASVPLGFGLGLAVWLLVSVLLEHEPTMMVALTCGVLGAAAAISASLASKRS